ncbi:MAG: hypothetical protein RRA94_12530 [Bacteroidota bacterium]|nr:hypothetical protein [Bacteroidota bacterium]
MKRIETWTPEDEGFWAREGRRIADRNLWIAVPALLLAFAVWLYWSIIIVQMQNLGFPFTTEQLYMLPAVAGLSGATLRIPNSFLIAMSGGRNVIFLTTTLLLLPAALTGFALQDMQTPYIYFVVAAALSGLGGGNFASSMSNISFFFPKRRQGLALGVNAGLGNLGVSVMQVLLPAIMGVALLGAFSGEGIPLPPAAEESAGTPVYVQNSGFVWIPALLLLSALTFFGMNNLPMHFRGSALVGMAKALWLLLLGLTAAGAGLALLLWLEWNMWIVLPLTVLLTLLLMRTFTPATVRASLATQYAIFRRKHTWVMTWLYVMTFGSFIGYSAAFPKLIQDVFGSLADGTTNAAAPDPLAYAWLGPLVGSLARPFGGWLSDKWGGARVTHWDTVVMIAAAVAVAVTVQLAREAATPEAYFPPFLAAFLVLFIATGVGNGSTFRMVPIIFEPAQAGPVLGWTSAVAAYGAFIIPKIFGAQIQSGHAEYALYGFAAYYVSCLVVNWWYYARKNAEISC